METMATSVRNIDAAVYRKIKARAALEGKTVGQVISEALRGYLGGEAPAPREPSTRADSKSRRRGSPAAPPKAAARRFVRPFPQRGAFVENPMVVFEVEPER